MPACGSPCRFEPARDEQAVSEVVGYVLIFGILSMILILSMLAFAAVQERAEKAVVAIEGESIAQRVASVVVNAALFAERHPTDSTYLQPLDLPVDLEGNSYSIVLEPASPGQAARIRVDVPSLDLQATAPLFSADAATTVQLCSTSVTGGRISVRFDLTNSCPGIFLDDLP